MLASFTKKTGKISKKYADRGVMIVRMTTLSLQIRKKIYNSQANRIVRNSDNPPIK